MSQTIDTIEKQRLNLQTTLEALKTKAERNRLGQFATPTTLAVDMLKYAATLMPSGETLHFLDPAIGTGVFYSALQSVFPNQRIIKALGFEIELALCRTNFTSLGEVWTCN